MNIFKDYAAYYNLVYQDKEYRKEAEYIISLMQQYNPHAQCILNLGCGTGKHDLIFSEKGYDVTGVDLSPEMVDLAKEEALKNNSGKILQFLEGDIRDVRLERQFDVVLALFHVMSYQTANSDLARAFETAYKHLKPGGLFIFDCWYGPGVLSDPPVVRLKSLENEHMEVNRIAQPQSHPNDNIIDVNYNIIIKEKQSGQYSEIKEKHRMRYLFKPELEMYFDKANLHMLHFEEWMTKKVPDMNSWYVCFVVKK